METRKQKRNSFNGMLLYFLLLMMGYGFAIPGYGQSAYRGTLNGIRQTGYHKILVTPDITGKSNADLSDLRIRAEDGKQVPYMLKREDPSFDGKEIRDFPVIADIKNDSISELVLETLPAHSSYEEERSLALVIKNANALRQARISGSNDRNNWYAVIDNMVLGNNTGADRDAYIQFISLPSNSYRFLKISVFNRGLPPLDITNAGIVLSRFIQGAYDALPSPAIIQKDSTDGKSYITLSFREPYPVSKLKWETAGAALYKRKARIYDGEGRSLDEILLTPEADSLLLPGRKEREIRIVIENNDDAPLQVSNATAWQLQQYVIADLTAGKRYSIETGNEKAVAPVYDLVFFADKITLVDEVITPGLLETRSMEEKVKGTEKTGKQWLWIFIIIALALLLLLSNRLLQNIAKNRNDRS